ncbi:MAG TPA: hypothetical protein VF790_10855 [Dissulfurispiraceae bacterium]
MNQSMDVSLAVERFDLLIQLAEEHLEYVRGTIYEKYAENLLEEVIAEKEEYLARVAHSN